MQSTWQSILESLQSLFQDTKLSYYLMLIQIPVVIALSFQCLQAYRLKFKGFGFVTMGWIINLCYLAFTAANFKLDLDDHTKLVIRTSFDAFCMFFFLLAGFSYGREEESPHVDKSQVSFFLKKNLKIYLIVLLIISAYFKTLQFQQHSLNFIRLYYIPNVFMDFIILWRLSNFFKKFAASYNVRNKMLVFATRVYASVQLIWLFQFTGDSPSPKPVSMLDNIGFMIGLAAKLTILLNLYLLIIRVMKIRAEESQQKLLQKLNFATKILDIKEYEQLDNAGIKQNEQEDYIIKAVLSESLDLLSVKLGYFGKLNENNEKITVAFTSERYSPLQGRVYESWEGVTGQAVTKSAPEWVNDVSRSDNHFKFADKGIADTLKIDGDVKSAVAVPLKINGKVEGVFLFESEVINYFTETQFKIFEAMVKHASTAIENIRLLQEIEYEKTVIDSLKIIDENIVKDILDLDHLLKLILEKSQFITNSELVNISLLNEKNELVIRASRQSGDYNLIINIENSITGRVFKTGEAEYIRDIDRADEETQRLFKKVMDEKAVCSLTLPLKVDQTTLGVLNVESRERNKYSEDAIKAMEGFVAQAAVAVYASLLFQDKEKNKNRLQQLGDIEQFILDFGKTLPDILAAILSSGLELTNKKHGEILLLETDQTNQKKLIIKKSTSVGHEGKEVPAGSVICWLSVEYGKTVYVPYIDKEEPAPPGLNRDLVYVPTEEERLKYKAPLGPEMKSELIEPIMLNNEVIGLLNFESDEYNSFREDDIKFLRNLAHTAAMAIHNSRQFEEVSRAKQALENSINRDKIIMAELLRGSITHRIGNSAGAILYNVKDILRLGKQEKMSERISKKLRSISASAENALQANDEINSQVIKLLTTKPELLDFSLIKEKLMEIKALKERSDIQICISGLRDLKPVKANQALFEECMLELINNAIKAMSKGGKIEISGKNISKVVEKKEREFVEVTITDDGDGISDEKLSTLFSPVGWSGSIRSSGRGLFFLSSFVGLFDGTVDVKSQLKKGTTFTIQLPSYSE